MAICNLRSAVHNALSALRAVCPRTVVWPRYRWRAVAAWRPLLLLPRASMSPRPSLPRRQVRASSGEA